MNTKNQYFIDNLKAIGIILVVIGHVFPRESVNIIYLFHMPLFFLLSGFLFKPQDATNYSIKKTNRLLIPYLCFLLTLYLINSIINITFSHNSIHDVYKGFSKLLYGGAKLKGDFGAFWFATTLFFSLITLNFLTNKLKTKSVAFITCTLYLLAFLNQYYFPEFRLPLAINICLYAIPLIFIGWFLSKYTAAFKTIAYAGLLIMIIQLYTTGHLDKVDLKSAMYGTPITCTIIAISFFYFIINLCKKAPRFNLLSYIGKSSLTIMFTHQWIHFHLRELGISNIYILLFITLTISVFINFTLERLPKCRQYFLGEKKQGY